MTQEFVKALVGSLLRWLLAGIAGYLIREGVLTGGQFEIIVGAAAAAVVSFVWAFVKTSRHVRRLRIALGLPKGSTLRDLKAVVAYQKLRGGPLA